MKVVVNIIRLSSFSIAQRTLGATTGKAGNKEVSGSDYSDMDLEKEPILVHHQFPASKRSQQPQSRANPTYVIKSNGSTACMFHKERVHDINTKKEQCVDESASVYINKIRNKLGRGL
ncbi:hypothetical protein SESBI_02775 [Sesbania bispinosa]|nr:hypothetical protein SESBI_02775 [Sesbania bispinosa]